MLMNKDIWPDSSTFFNWLFYPDWLWPLISNKAGTEPTSTPDYLSNMVAEDTLASEPQVCYWVYFGNVILQEKTGFVNPLAGKSHYWTYSNTSTFSDRWFYIFNAKEMVVLNIFTMSVSTIKLTNQYFCIWGWIPQ